MPKKNDGTKSQDEFERLVNAKPQHRVHRMRDKKDLMGLNKGKRVAAFALPSDYIIYCPDGPILAEVKSTSNKTSFPYGNIEPGQRAAASFSAACGSKYWFFIQRMSDGAWFQLSAAEFAADIKAGKKSRKFEELTPCDHF